MDQQVRLAKFIVENVTMLQTKLGIKIDTMLNSFSGVLYVQDQDIFLEYPGWIEHGGFMPPYDQSKVTVKIWLGELSDKLNALMRFKLYYLAHLHGSDVFEHLGHYFLVNTQAVGMFRERLIADLMYRSKCTLDIATKCVDNDEKMTYLGYGLRQALRSAHSGLLP